MVTRAIAMETAEQRSGTMTRVNVGYLYQDDNNTASQWGPWGGGAMDTFLHAIRS